MKNGFIKVGCYTPKSQVCDVEYNAQNIIEGINRMANLADEESEFMQNMAKEVYDKICIEENIKEKKCVLDLKKFQNQALVIKRRVIIYTINRIFGATTNIQKVHIEDIIDLCNNNIGGKFLTPNKNMRFEIKNKKIIVSGK